MAEQAQGVPAPPSHPAQAQAGQQALQQQEQHAPPAQQGQQWVHLIWSHFKPEFSVKPDEDAEAHLLALMTWWMNIILWKELRFKDFV